jgi:hypothetical protein
MYNCADHFLYVSFAQNLGSLRLFERELLLDLFFELSPVMACADGGPIWIQISFLLRCCGNMLFCVTASHVELPYQNTSSGFRVEPETFSSRQELLQSF